MYLLGNARGSISDGAVTHKPLSLRNLIEGEPLSGRVMLGQEMTRSWLQVRTLAPRCWKQRVPKRLCLIDRVRTISGAENVIVLPKHYIYRACEVRLGSYYSSKGN